MDRNTHEGIGDDFFEQILAVPPAFDGGESAEYGGSEASSVAMALQLGSGVGGGRDDCGGSGGGLRGIAMQGLGMPLGLNLEQSFLRRERFGEEIEANGRNNANNNVSSSTSSGISERDSLHMNALIPTFGHVQCQSFRPEQPPSQIHQPFPCQPISGQIPAVSHPPAIRPRVRARRGQATDPHSIAERLRRERIAERMKALQELVPSCNKSDRAAMLDEIVDYVKFLRLQVKVLSMSRLGGAGAVAQLISDVPGTAVVEGIEGGNDQQAWEKWSTDGTEQQVAKLMEEDIGAAMQLLQSKALCIMPISLASAIFRTHQPDTQMAIKPESDPPFLKQGMIVITPRKAI